MCKQTNKLPTHTHTHLADKVSLLLFYDVEQLHSVTKLLEVRAWSLCVAAKHAEQGVVVNHQLPGPCITEVGLTCHIVEQLPV